MYSRFFPSFAVHAHEMHLHIALVDLGFPSVSQVIPVVPTPWLVDHMILILRFVKDPPDRVQVDIF